MAKPALNQLRQAIIESWSEETAWPGSWTPSNPAAGQCRVTAAVVQDVLGGEVLMATIQQDPLYTHFWNRLPDGQEIDLTADQFTDQQQVPAGEPIERGELMKPEPMTRTYPVLLERVQEQLDLDMPSS